MFTEITLDAHGLEGTVPLVVLDTPEGIAARDELAARIEGRPVRVEFTRRKKASCAGPAGSVVFDRYGRLLAKIRPKPLSLQSSTHTSAPSMGWAASE